MLGVRVEHSSVQQLRLRRLVQPRLATWELVDLPGQITLSDTAQLLIPPR